MMNNADFNPDWVSLPGETIKRCLRNQRMSIHELAQKIEGNVDEVKQLIVGCVSITHEIAQKLERAIGLPASFWISREKDYQVTVEKLRESEEDHWIKQMPIREMTSRNWIEPTEDYRKAMLDYFAVPNVFVWKKLYSSIETVASFRKSQTLDNDLAATAVWLRQGEILANKYNCEKWNSQKFQLLLPTIKRLTGQKNPEIFIPKLRELCASAGVAVVILKTIPGCTASGAVKFMNDEKAMMLLSFRYLSDDHFWFTFFHEAGHLVLHKNEPLIIESGESQDDSLIEREANQFASETLIPKHLRSYVMSMQLSKRNLMSVARDADVSLGILIGQLQFMGRLNFDQFNHYKRRFDWSSLKNITLENE